MSWGCLFVGAVFWVPPAASWAYDTVKTQSENLTGITELGAEHLELGWHEAHDQTMRWSCMVAGSGIVLSILFYLLGWLNPRTWAARLRRVGL